MKRRDILALFGIVMSLWPQAGIAGTRKPPTVGILVVGSAGSAKFWRIFRQVMEERGYTDGQTIHYEFRSDQGDIRRLPELAEDLVRDRVDVIVTWFTPAAQAAKEATREIPVVMALAGNPVENGIVKSLAHPGGNITGIAGMGAELAGKGVELVHDMLPSGRRFGALANASDPFAKPFVEYIRRAGRMVGVDIYQIMIGRGDELDKVFMTIKEHQIDALIIQPSLPTTQIATLGMQNRMPAVSIISGFAESGGLMSYQTSDIDMYRLSANYVDRILKGAKPGDLPILQPTKFQLVINLKTAKAIDIMVPDAFLARADKIIE